MSVLGLHKYVWPSNSQNLRISKNVFASIDIIYN